LRIGACTWLLSSGELAETSVPFVLIKRAAARIAKQQWDEALRDLDQAIRVNPNLPEAHAHQGRVFYERQQWARAIASFDAAIGLEPTPVVHRLRGISRLRTGQADRAIEDLDQAIRLNAEDGYAHYYRGEARHGLGQLEASIRDYEQAVRLLPTDPRPANDLAWLRATAKDQRLQDIEAALRLARQSIAIRKIPANLDTLGAVFARRGELEKALVAYKDAMELGGESRVRLYQNDLKRRGFYNGPIDGATSRALEQAMTACLRARCIPLLD
jgi:tetratricopeptide (TPR) repeat protein